MRKESVIFILMMFLSCVAMSAQEPLPAADAVEAADTVEMSDEEIMKLLASPKADTVKKVIDRGFDVSRMVNSRRQRAQDYTTFSSKPFLSNTFASARLTTSKILTEDYGYGLSAGASFGKWLHQDHAVRLGASAGQWQENHTGQSVLSLSLDASYLFNLSSYVGGYRTNRFCEVMIVAGAGYSMAYLDKISHALDAHAGFNVNMRLFKNIDFYVEPLAVIHTNGMAVAYAGNWRSWLSSAQITCGLTYNMMRSASPDSERLMPRTAGWFVTLMGGPHSQNSGLVYDIVGFGKSLGVHLGLGLGKYYTDWFAIRYSAAFARSTWVVYEASAYPCNYFSVRAEASADIVGLIRHASGKEGRPAFSASVLLGPEAGYMYKVDHPDSPARVISSAYLGLTGGVQAKMRFGKRLALFAEPRFSLIPYEAPSHNSMANQFRNYYDGIMNLNFGIEYLL